MIKTQNIIILFIVIVASYLAITDTKLRDNYYRLADIAIGGYLGQLLPSKRED